LLAEAVISGNIGGCVFPGSLSGMGVQGTGRRKKEKEGRKGVKPLFGDLERVWRAYLCTGVFHLRTHSDVSKGEDERGDADRGPTLERESRGLPQRAVLFRV
jgi:hypothetical protein